VSTVWGRRGILLSGWIIGLALACVAASGQAAPRIPCYKPDEYEQVLDAYFAHAHGDVTSNVVLRNYGGLIPEYELVLYPNVSTHSIFWYRPKKAIWDGAYDGFSAGKRRSIQDYISRALKVPFTKEEIGISEAQFSDFITRAATVDTSTCEHLPLKDSRGNEHVIEDAPWLELIVNGGRTRAHVTDTSDFSYIVSQNPELLRWASDIQKILRDHLRSSIR